ncbi:chromo domain-containing protein cec-4-like [Actinia tenebrosa]|uniref:Chromo domain-containing protein cec-4-like n=1 Tax=Actinia tenebrosa TaxID=6105 RepID=A0A6P8IM68_ACTTE|nr:chromo domain-containing protein cec-4-like [Actinia tenebrosa]
MAASSNRKSLPGFYKQLNESPVWFFEPVKVRKKTKRSSGPYYAVERLISKRIFKGNTEYLVKWEAYSLYYFSWEDEGNLTRDLIRSYDKPVIEKSRLQANIDTLSCTILS